MKNLISWLAYQHDFIRDKTTGAVTGIDPEGTNYSMHRYFYSYDRHIILCSNSGDANGAEMLRAFVIRDFPGHVIEIVQMDIKDPIDLSEIKPKVEAKLMELSHDETDIFVSPGTPAMYLAWYICHTTLGLKTRLIQTRPARFSKTNKPELLTIEVEKSQIPVTSVIKEQRLDTSIDQEESGYILTNSIKGIYKKAELLAQTDKVSVFIHGETGTGKEHLARFIHEHSIRRNKPYVTVNCSAFHDQLLESRLFGYRKGAFTGAEKDTAGLFEMADGGTIFLDEIGDISPYMQQSLLRVLQEKEIQPVGGRSKKVNVRVISATNQDLATKCKEGKFRWDLYYRLVVVELELPDLLSRGAKEIEEMIGYFLKVKRKELKKSEILKLSQEVKQFLINYSWPGNVREMENLVETLYVLNEKEVSVSDLPARFRNATGENSLKWEDVEKAHIEKVLRLKKGNQRQAWLALGYGSINTLRKKISEYDIHVPED